MSRQSQRPHSQQSGRKPTGICCCWCSEPGDGVSDCQPTGALEEPDGLRRAAHFECRFRGEAGGRIKRRLSKGARWPYHQRIHHGRCNDVRQLFRGGMMRRVWFTMGILCSGVVVVAAETGEPTPAALEFFEKQVRPVLVEHCQKCHGPQEHKGGLRVDSHAALLKGGESGPAIVPGKADKSLLIEAVTYDPDGYQMPPSGKLPDTVIAVLKEWVQTGAAWPKETGNTATEDKGIDLVERAKHWSFQPLGQYAPPAVEDAGWSRNGIDRFIVQKLAAAGLKPAPRAAQHTLYRRWSLGLTGLPPSPADVAAFEADPAADATERAVERLLASPHYGERWGRHWLDLVRFAETSGHEFDFEIPFAWPYRDYVTRAFNADLPYDQFVREHLAGDLLAAPRRDPVSHINESVIGTAFYWFGQGKHSPVDLRAEECDTVDNQVDVIGKTFLGLTIACARCHDHKFDAITQRDYYGTAGFLQSSRQTLADYNPPEATQSIVADMLQADRRQGDAAVAATVAQMKVLVSRLPELLMADPDKVNGVPAKELTDWRKAMLDEARSQRAHPLHWWALCAETPDQVPRRLQDLRRQPRRVKPTPETADQATIRSPFDAETPEQHWFYEDSAFSAQPTEHSQWLFSQDPLHPVRGVVRPGTWATSGAISSKLRGTLRSPTFTITTKYIDYWGYRIGGEDHVPRSNKVGQISIIIDGFQFIRNPLYGHLTWNVPRKETPQHFRQDVSKFIGSKAYIEIEDLDDGSIVLDRVEFHDGAPLAENYNLTVTDALRSAPADDLRDVAAALQSACNDVLTAVQREQLYGAPAWTHNDPSAADLFNWLLRQPRWLAPTVPTPNEQVQQFIRERHHLEEQLPRSQWVIGMRDGSAENEAVLIRGNPKKPGPPSTRRFLEVFAGEKPVGPPEHEPGSGRLAWAESFVDGSNPLAARVIVNRLWQHHFGRGLVNTPDDFGKMGQPPTHPELLDWLAAELIRSDWSLKHIQRLILTSATYAQSSALTDARATELDPNNLLLHRQNIQRLSAEAVRDSLISLSGRLDDRMYGPSVLPHLTPFMEGRGRPNQSGPLDGNGRRSLYINIRRNFLTPFFLAFDFPTPFTTMGKRSTSNVPAQALTMMNNPLVVQQTSLWVERLPAGEPAARMQALYHAAFARPPTAEETAAALEFLAQQTQATDTAQAWRDLAHVLVNVKEFVFVD